MKSHILHHDETPEPASFRLALQRELARRCAANARYSLRAFAKYLGVDHSTLSQLLRGKRQFNEQTIRKFGVRLGYDEATIDTWQHREALNQSKAAIPQEIKQLSEDMALLMTDMNHYALLELTRVEGFQADSRWIARMLGITVDEVNIVVQCLLRLGMLEMASPTRWVDQLGDAMSSLHAFNQASMAHYLEQVHRLTMRSLNATSASRSMIRATTLAVSSQRIPLALDMLAQFCQQFAQTLTAADEQDAVYQFHLSFVPVFPLSE